MKPLVVDAQILAGAHLPPRTAGASLKHLRLLEAIDRPRDLPPRTAGASLKHVVFGDPPSC